MSGKRAVIAVLAVVMSILGGSAAAQDEKNELSGSIGRMFISDQSIIGAANFNPVVRSGNGLTFEVNYARRILGTPVLAISGDAPAVFDLDENLNSGDNVVPKNYKQIFITPSARLNLFPDTAVSPSVSLGGGLAPLFPKHTPLCGGPNPGSSSTSGVLQGGFGLDVRVLHQFSIRLDVRDFWSGTPSLPLADTGKSRQHNFFVGGGVV